MLDELQRMDELYGDCMDKLSGPTLISYPGDVDSTRLTMFTSNSKQFLNLESPDVPHIMTGYENEFGKRNKAFRKLNGSWKIMDKIRKFENDYIYTLVLYNHKTDTYDMIEKRIAESLTEKFGYIYNNEIMDSYDTGETINDKIIYKTTSYDDNMNYRIGKNANVAYTTDDSTLEDAIKIRRGWADSVKTYEIESVVVSINNNDIPLNIYHNNVDEYKAFADIGEKVKDCTVCGVRRINLDHVLYDLLDENLKRVYDTDTSYVISAKNSIVYDINVYCNNIDELPDNIFYKQIRYYLNACNDYADKVTNWCKTIKKSNSNYTNGVLMLKAKYQHFSDQEYKWNNKGKVFSNIVIEFKTKGIIDLQEGFKLVGRYGDKGIVSSIVGSEDTTIDTANNIIDSIADILERENSLEVKKRLASNVVIVEDTEMPYKRDGTPVDILLNASGAVRRLNTGQLYEVELNFISENLRAKICTLDSIEAKEAYIFKFLEILNTDQYEYTLKVYESYDKTYNINGKQIRFLNSKAKNEFITSIEKDGFYIVKPPYANIRYDVIKSLYEEFDWIKPYDLFIDIFGIKGRKIMKPMVVGSKYMFLLKQTSNKNFSARSTGRIDKKGLPAKSNDKKNNRTVNSNTPISISEVPNMMPQIEGVTLAIYNLFMRSSTLARMSMKCILAAEDNPLALKELKMEETFVNVNADILNAYMKSLGIQFKFVSSDEQRVIEMDVPTTFVIDGYTIMDYPSNKHMYMKLFDIRKQILNENIIVTNERDKNKFIWNLTFQHPDAKDLELPDGMKELLLDTDNSEFTANNDPLPLPIPTENTEAIA